MRKNSADQTDDRQAGREREREGEKKKERQLFTVGYTVKLLF